MKLKTQEFLRRLELAGESLSSFATRCSFSRQAVSAWVNCERNPKPVNVKTMAEKLRCRVEDIAEPQTALEDVAVRGDKFAQSLLGMGDPVSAVGQDAPETPASDLMNFIAARLAAEVASSSQSEVARRIGVSVSQINRLMKGKADLSLLPVAALQKLCPDLINRDTLTGEVTVAGDAAVSVQFAPDDPFLQIILEKWDDLSFEDRGRLAGVVSSITDKKPGTPAPVTAICPKCHTRITEPHEHGDKFECPNCGQHMRAR